MSEPKGLPPRCPHIFSDSYGLKIALCESCGDYGVQCAGCGRWMAEYDSMWCTCLFRGLAIGGHPDSWRYCSDHCVMNTHRGQLESLPGHESFLSYLRIRMDELARDDEED